VFIVVLQFAFDARAADLRRDCVDHHVSSSSSGSSHLSAICWQTLALGAHLEHDPLDAAPDRKITTPSAPSRAA